MPNFWFAIPGDAKTLTGGYIYAQRLIKSLPSAGWHPHLLPLPGGFPNPTKEELKHTQRTFEKLPEGAVVLVDGLAFGSLPQDMLNGLDLRFAVLVHHPLALESGLSKFEESRLHASEKAALKMACVVLTTGPSTARTLITRFGVDTQKLFVAPPGTHSAGRAQRRRDVPQLLTVAPLTYRKGHDVLVHALAAIADLQWESVWTGSMTREPKTTSMVRDMIKSYDLEDRIDLRGEVDSQALQNIYLQSNAFVLPSRHEGYGMAFAEAMAYGLPVIGCAVGAVPETVPGDASLLVKPDDPKALAIALRQLLKSTDGGSALADAAWFHGQQLPRWSDTAKAVAKALSVVIQ